MLYPTPKAIGTTLMSATPLGRLNYRLAWDKKMRIALLTLITFMALC